MPGAHDAGGADVEIAVSNPGDVHVQRPSTPSGCKEPHIARRRVGPAARCIIGYEGPGYDQCVVELRGATGPLSGPCADDCTLTPTMEAQNATANVCSAACANEFVVHCLPHHSPNGCSQCRSEINSQTGPLATVCAANCVDTASMTTACSSG